MNEKVVHVIVVGLSEEGRRQLDQKTLEMLHYNDPSWQYQSYWCDSVEQAELLWAVSLPLLALPMLPPPRQGQRRRTYDAMILAGMQIGVRH
jgi:hypothetical protein